MAGILKYAEYCYTKIHGIEVSFERGKNWKAIRRKYAVEIRNFKPWVFVHACPKNESF